MMRFRPSIWFVAFIVLAAFDQSRADEASQLVIGKTFEQFQKSFDKLTGEGLRPATLQACDIDGRPQINALFVKDERSLDWITRTGMSSGDFEKEIHEQSAQGYRPVSVTCAIDGRAPRFGVILVRDGGRRRWEVVSDQKTPELERAIKQFADEGLRPETITGYPIGKGARFVALFAESAGHKSDFRINLSLDEAKRFVNDLSARELRPISISSYRVGEQLQFAIVGVGDGVPGDARFELTVKDVDKDIESRASQGFRARSSTKYISGESLRCAVLYEKPATDLPMTGECPTELAAYDEAMQRHLQEQHIRGATLAVSRNGKLLIQRGYGFKDAEEQEAMPPDAMLRIASVTKPITAIAIQKLIAEKKIDGDTKVREYLEIQPPDDATVDPRWDKITIQNLLSHRGGWDRSAAQEGHDDGFDPMFFPELVGKTLGEAPPLKPVHFVRFMLGQPLQFEPGERYEYSNFGYCVLGRVIEKASGMFYGDFIAKEICDPLGATDVKIGRSLVKDRNPREPVYAGAGVSENVLTAEHDEVRWPDGGFLLEGMDSHGGVIASAAHLAKIFDAYWIDGTPRVVGGNARWAHFGSLPGTFAVAAQRPGGLTVVVLLNQRSGKGSRDEQILKRMDEAAEQITEWPSN